MKALEQVALLFDFYGPLLTPRQQELVRAYFLDDLSLGEIADLAGVSRQAVHDQIKRAETTLSDFESRLGLVAEYRLRRQRVADLAAHLQAMVGVALPEPAAGHLAAAAAIAQELMEDGDLPPR